MGFIPWDSWLQDSESRRGAVTEYCDKEDCDDEEHNHEVPDPDLNEPVYGCTRNQPLVWSFRSNGQYTRPPG